MLHIAVLQSNRQLADTLMAWLAQAGYRFTCCSESAEFAACLKLHAFDLLLVDCACVDQASFGFIEQGLSCPSGPVPLLYVSPPDAEGVVRALEYGADDYVVKPLSRDELLSRIAVLLRRFGSQSGESLPRLEQFGPFRIDRGQRLIWREDRLLVLTDKDFSLADYLFRHSNQMLSRRRLLAEVWGVNQRLNTRTVDVHISHLRKSLALQGSGYDIRTVHQHGYRLQRDQIEPHDGR